MKNIFYLYVGCEIINTHIYKKEIILVILFIVNNLDTLSI